jgi:hypothetical protein
MITFVFINPTGTLRLANALKSPEYFASKPSIGSTDQVFCPFIFYCIIVALFLADLMLFFDLLLSYLFRKKTTKPISSLATGTAACISPNTNLIMPSFQNLKSLFEIPLESRAFEVKNNF